jgi:hypothetical protein
MAQRVRAVVMVPLSLGMTAAVRRSPDKIPTVPELTVLASLMPPGRLRAIHQTKQYYREPEILVQLRGIDLFSWHLKGDTRVVIEDENGVWNSHCPAHDAVLTGHLYPGIVL